MERSFVCPIQEKKMAYYEWRSTKQPAKEGSKPQVVVCVHGLSQNGHVFEFLAHGLVEDAEKRGTECHVYAVDLVGRGNSEWLDDRSLYNPGTYALHMIPFIEEIAKQHGLSSVNYVGTSLGGIIGMLICFMNKGHLFEKLILNDIGGFVPSKSLQRIGEYVGLDPRFKTFEEAEQYMKTIYSQCRDIPQEQFAHFTKYATKQIHKGADVEWALIYDPKISSGFKGVPPDIELWPQYESINVPTLLIHGTDSDILLQSTVEEMKGRGPGAKGLLQVYDVVGTGHPPYLSVPAQIHEVVKFFTV
eukprot:TRINITY_DN687_c0_g1_i16.p1 TRINITY_DN687_c0_g1~~TRINITY_DN687_c0_g1_i16.p1  ORF type:complete len:303 (+),score=62.24 TRINITY_DN687_c0_g1_i16:292-1200(+)